jgi:hypothetical protein
MKTITLQGTEEQIEYLGIVLNNFAVDTKLPKAVETRVYVVDSDDNRYSDDMSDDLFMDLAEEQGTVYTLPTFQEAFNYGDVNTFTDVIRFINQPLYL